MKDIDPIEYEIQAIADRMLDAHLDDDEPDEYDPCQDSAIGEGLGEEEDDGE
jgi:hypothetical protein